MIILFIFITVQAYQLFGNYSLRYYYLQLNDTQYIIDQHFDGCIIEQNDQFYNPDNNYKAIQAQRFIHISMVPTENQTIKLYNSSFQCYYGVYYAYKQQINNYIGLNEFIQSQTNEQLKVCLAQNGGYLKINNFEKDDTKIILQLEQQNCDQQQYCLSQSLIFRNIIIKGNKLIQQNIYYNAEIDFTSSYIYLDTELLYQFRQQFICQGFFCPIRNDKDGLICYDKNEDQNIDNFYKYFPELEFQFGIQMKQSVQVQPRDYLVTDDQITYCLPFKNGNGRIILGQPFFRNKEFLYKNNHIIINYQNCEIETSLEQPTISLRYRNTNIIVNIFDWIYIIQKIKQKQYNDKSIHLMIIILFSLAYSQIVYDLQYDGSEYIINLLVGTPSNEVKFILDTGAPYTMFTCNEDSKTLEYQQCGQQKCMVSSETYGGEFGYAYLASDYITVDKDKSKYYFECNINNQSNLLGMGSQNMFINQIFNKQFSHEYRRVFSLFLQHEKGVLKINDKPKIITEFAMPFSKTSPYFQIEIQNIKDDQDNLIFQPKKDVEYEIIIDSGATLINVDSELRASFLKSFIKCESHVLGCPSKLFYQGRECFKYDWSQYGKIENFYDVFPQFSFNFDNGYEYILEPISYLEKRSNNIYCVPFTEFTRNYEEKYKKIYLFGQPFMRNKIFYFDLTQQIIQIENPQIINKIYQFNDISGIQIVKYIIAIVIIYLVIKYSSKIWKWLIRNQKMNNNNYNPYNH